jgi:Protein of unknown function (DUF3102)
MSAAITTTAASIVLEPDKERLLKEHVVEIHHLLKRTIQDIVELGRRYTECKKIVGHGHWLAWLKGEFGVDDDRLVRIWMQVYEKSKLEKFSDLMKRDLPTTAFYLLSAPSVPESVLDEIANRAAEGERIFHEDVKKAIAGSRRKKNGGQAKETEPAPGENIPTPPATNDVDNAASAAQRGAYYAGLDQNADHAGEVEQLSVGDREHHDEQHGDDQHHDVDRADSARTVETPISTKSKTKKPSLVESWEGTPDERRAIRDLVIEEYFATVTGAQLLSHMSTGQIRNFLDALGVAAMCRAMSEEFGRLLRAAMPAPKGKSGQSDKPFKTTLQMGRDGADAAGNPNFAQEVRGNRSRH